MNPELLIVLGKVIVGAVAAAPDFMKEFEAIKAAGSATPDQLQQLTSQIETMEAARQQSWKAADDALDAAAKT